MRYKLFDQATRDLVVECAKQLANGKITVADASLTFVVHLEGNDDPRLDEPLDTFVFTNSEADNLHLGVRPYAAPSFKAELDRRVARFEEFYKKAAVAAADKIISLLENPELGERIALIFAEAWDPIGVGNLKAGESLYDEYVPAMRELLRVEATEREIADHLIRIEDEILKFPIDRDRALKVARLLIESSMELRAQPAATWADGHPC